MDAIELKRQLQHRVHEFCHYLLPGGRKRGHEYRCGSVEGGAGDSLGVHLTGQKAGVWADFATGEKGDLFELVQRARGCSFVEALDIARDYLGVERPAFHPIAPARKYVRPERPATVRTPKAESPVLAYLTRERGLSLEAVRAYQIGEEERDGRWRIVFPYKRDGELLMLKWLYLDRPEGKKEIGTTKDSEPCLFGWQAIPDSAREVVICEGEIDALTWWQAGVPALSVPRGTGSLEWIESEYAALERFETIYLAFDADEPGQKAAARVLPRFGDRGRLLGHLDTTRYGKDANAWMLAGASRDDFARLVERARENRPETLKSPFDYAEEVVGLFYPKPGAYQGFEPPFGRIAGRVRFRPSELSIWTGYNHHGKTEMLNYLMVVAAAQGERICIASLEVPPAKTVKRLVRQATGEERPSPARILAALEWLSEYFLLYDRVGSADERQILAAFRYAVSRFGATQLVLDNLARMGVGEDDYDRQAKVISHLVDFVIETVGHLHLVGHPRKAQDETTPPGKLDVRGGMVITDLAHNVFAQWRNVRKHERIAELESRCDPMGEIPAIQRNEEDAVWLVLKQKETGETPKVRLWWDRHSLQFHEEPYATPICFVPALHREPARVEPEVVSEPLSIEWREDDEPLPF